MSLLQDIIIVLISVGVAVCLVFIVWWLTP